MKYILDTNICIYAIKRVSRSVIEKVKQNQPHDIGISAVTVAELEYGAAKSTYPERNRIVLLSFISAFDILAFDDVDGETFGRVRADLEKRGLIIGPYDLQIAAQALRHELVLVTNNTKEFTRISDLRLENWTKEEE